eukprot:SAG22_NODE_23418_length_150_cov_8.823529_1_plen_32_part_10
MASLPLAHLADLGGGGGPPDLQIKYGPPYRLS